jgi:hypothetical protein
MAGFVDQATYEGTPGLQLPNMASLEGRLIDVSAIDNAVPAQQVFNVRLYDDVAHSARQEGGRWWHKFTTRPFLISIENHENLHYANVTANFQVLSATTAGNVGNFLVP